jgi:hypothetical protein
MAGDGLYRRSALFRLSHENVDVAVDHSDKSGGWKGRGLRESCVGRGGGRGGDLLVQVRLVAADLPIMSLTAAVNLPTSSVSSVDAGSNKRGEATPRMLT